VLVVYPEVDARRRVWPGQQGVCLGIGSQAAGRVDAAGGPGERGRFSLVAERAKLRQEHIIWRRVLGMVFKHRTLKVLHLVSLAVQIALLGELFRDRETLLRQPAVSLPV